MNARRNQLTSASADAGNPACATLRLRRLLADGIFLKEQLYRDVESRFAGSTYRAVIRASIPENLSVENAVAAHLAASNVDRHRIDEVLHGYANRLPPEVQTLVELPSETPFDAAPDMLQHQSQIAIRHAILAHSPYGWLFARLSRLLRPAKSKDAACTQSEAFALLCNYHSLSIGKARTRYPEVWNPAEGALVLDSRGMLFAREFVDALQARKLLRRNSVFLDIGSGIGTVALAFGLCSQTQAMGIEIHPGLSALAHSIRRRLARHGAIHERNVGLHLGDFKSAEPLLKKADVLYLYSPLGPKRIDVDKIVDLMREEAVLVSDRMPNEALAQVTIEPNIVGLFVLRKRRSDSRSVNATTT